jgi:hypothetical protein
VFKIQNWRSNNVVIPNKMKEIPRVVGGAEDVSIPMIP